MRMIIILILLAAKVSSAAENSGAETAFTMCASLSNPEQRLDCYDGFADRASQPELIFLESTVKSTRVIPTEIYNDEQRLPADSQDSQMFHFLLPGLSAEGPNYFGTSTAHDAPHRGVETHLEFDISVKYPFAESLLASLNRTRPKFMDRFYFIYNGSYDFQYLTGFEAYDSNPVISKAQNPGLVAEWDLKEGMHRLRGGVYHHSNGQTATEARVDDINFLISNWGEEVGLERVSRSSWYWSLRYQIQSNRYGIVDANWGQFQAELRRYFREDNTFYWDAPIPKLQRLRDYDGLRVMGEKLLPLPLGDLGRNFRLLTRLELKTGFKSGAFLDKVSGEATLGLKWGSLTFALYYYNGYGKDISTYHRRFHYWGAGFEFR